MDSFDTISGIPMSSLTRGMSDINDPSPFLAPISLYQPTPNTHPAAGASSSTGAGGGGGGGNVNNGPFNFTASDLEDSTTYFPNNLYQQAALSVPSLARGETNNSLGLLFPSLSRTGTEDMTALFNNDSYTSAIPPPFPPNRGFSEISLTFDEFGQAIAVAPAQPPISTIDSNGNAGSASLPTSTTSQSFGDSQLYDQHSPPSSMVPLPIHQRPPQQQNGVYGMMHPLAQNVNAINDYDHSRIHKRIRADVPEQPSPMSAVPYFRDPHTAYSMNQQMAAYNAHQKMPRMSSPTLSTGSASPSLGSQTSLSVSVPAIPSRVNTAPSPAVSSVLPTSQPSPHARVHSSDDNASVAPSVAGGEPRDSPTGADGDDREVAKKVKHQLTDRQRRAKIKESMDQLKALVPLETSQKADQATVVAESVELIKGMKDEIAALRAKIAQMELTSDGKGDPGVEAVELNTDTSLALAKQKYLHQWSFTSSAPFSAMTASLNGAGVSMTRMSLDGRILEVNLVFEMVTGFNGSELINRTPCDAPLFGHLSVIPKQFLKYFNSVSFSAATQSEKESENGAPVVSPGATPGSTPSSPNSEDYLSQSSAASHSSTRSSGTGATAASPLFSNVTISSLPIVPHNQLQSFFPFKCKALPDPMHSSTEPSMTSNVGPHAQYLMNHLSKLPPNHVLKLLSRTSTSYGDTLESIQTFTLVRTPTGQPHYILSLTTPDGRRLVKPTKFLSAQVASPVPGNVQHNQALGWDHQ